MRENGAAIELLLSVAEELRGSRSSFKVIPRSFDNARAIASREIFNAVIAAGSFLKYETTLRIVRGVENRRKDIVPGEIHTGESRLQLNFASMRWLGVQQPVVVLVTLCLVASPPRQATMELKLPRKFNSLLDMYRVRAARTRAVARSCTRRRAVPRTHGGPTEIRYRFALASRTRRLKITKREG